MAQRISEMMASYHAQQTLVLLRKTQAEAERQRVAQAEREWQRQEAVEKAAQAFLQEGNLRIAQLMFDQSGMHALLEGVAKMKKGRLGVKDNLATATHSETISWEVPGRIRKRKKREYAVTVSTSGTDPEGKLSIQGRRTQRTGRLAASIHRTEVDSALGYAFAHPRQVKYKGKIAKNLTEIAGYSLLGVAVFNMLPVPLELISIMVNSLYATPVSNANVIAEVGSFMGSLTVSGLAFLAGRKLYNYSQKH